MIYQALIQKKVKKEIEEVIGIDARNAILASAKDGVGIRDILEAVVKLVPAPTGLEEEPLQALIFDSLFDSYRGVIPSIRVINGTVKKGDIIEMMASNSSFEVVEVGVYTPKQEKTRYFRAW